MAGVGQTSPGQSSCVFWKRCTHKIISLVKLSSGFDSDELVFCVLRNTAAIVFLTLSNTRLRMPAKRSSPGLCFAEFWLDRARLTD
ncbi:hypothetical protein ES703_37914 [subsurface metagenome]